MTKTSGEFTKGLGLVLSGAKALYDFGVEKGLTTPEQLRLTVMARQAEAKRLVASGVSRRQAAKALGVSHQTIMRDTNGPKRTKDGPKRTTHEPAQNRAPLGRSEFLDNAGACLKLADYDGRVDAMVLRAARAVETAWRLLADKMEKEAEDV